jgi:hypothetical protein
MLCYLFCVQLVKLREFDALDLQRVAVHAGYGEDSLALAKAAQRGDFKPVEVFFLLFRNILKEYFLFSIICFLVFLKIIMGSNANEGISLLSNVILHPGKSNKAKMNQRLIIGNHYSIKKLFFCLL